ncbi:hypothetical protein J6590_004114 [Homalodisca vitripennis]|nr:hypothetical protein J6590_004114 [Homalodisca vitripennis]
MRTVNSGLLDHALDITGSRPHWVRSQFVTVVRKIIDDNEGASAGERRRALLEGQTRALSRTLSCSVSQHPGSGGPSIIVP